MAIEHAADCQLGIEEVPGLCTCDFDLRMRQAKRDAIRDEDLARMDHIAATKGENHPDFWTAMAFATERLRQFDQRQR